MGHHHRVARPGPHDGLSVIAAYGNHTLKPRRQKSRYSNAPRNGKNIIECHDGFTMSVRAGQGMHSAPSPYFLDYNVGEDYPGPYHAFECGYPSQRPEPWPLWECFADDPEKWQFIYNYVPLELIRHTLTLHGGFRRFAKGQVKW